MFKHHILPYHWLNSVLMQTSLPHITVHGLRHAFASIQVANNINVKTLQLQLGYFDIQTTLDIYTHFTQKEATANVYTISHII
ncbi:tyrosine-type recombinase/integrase [Levilactobacillus huananensis]|uniref:tyrosine-type recombinase/integrase n=1 Tax=Levilactobacillus huananensis TaxID=2486019 RepID=UPI001CDB5458|nr:tyrosine-type recombinase/integrase [Levilactobacillus huananensis]